MRFLAQKLETVFDEHALHDECDASLPLVLETVGAEVHPDPNVQLEEALHAIQVPGVEVDVVDGRGQDEDAVQLARSLSREVDLDAVEEGVLEDVGVVDLDMEDGAWRGRRKVFYRYV